MQLKKVKNWVGWSQLAESGEPVSYVRSLLRIDLAAALYHKGPPQQGPRRTLAPSGQPVGRRDIRKASENPQMFTPSRGSHKEEGFPDEPVMQPFALVLSLF